MRAVCVLLVIAACGAPAHPQAEQAAPSAREILVEASAASLAVPIDAAALARPIGGARGQVAWLGVRLDRGGRITQLVGGAPGERGGLRLGDRVLGVDGEAVRDGADLSRIVQEKGAGTAVEIAIERGGAPMTLKIVVEARPPSIANQALIGKAAPDFSASLLAGPYSANLADHKGSVVILDFWATWCGPCAVTIPRLNALHDRYAASGLRVIGVSSEEPAVIQKFVADRGIRYAIGHDPDDRIAHQFLREGLPMFVLIDKQGVVREVVSGADVDAVEGALPALLAQP
ncbi:MAG: redoxin domain-containing protein [Deltaproteobacteria bacterium]|nr:redoxin domain-containing protein [Deltaproteobacteria bacterium]MCW5807344.1 redoxin domain-containing protein [Deltaproteobacteria bacterium]